MSQEDHAQDQELAYWEAINRPRGKVRFTPGEPGYGPEYCVECDEDMTVQRRVWGFMNCVECQTKSEALKRR